MGGAPVAHEIFDLQCIRSSSLHYNIRATSCTRLTAAGMLRLWRSHDHHMMHRCVRQSVICHCYLQQLPPVSSIHCRYCELTLLYSIVEFDLTDFMKPPYLIPPITLVALTRNQLNIQIYQSAIMRRHISHCTLPQ